jgi:hypothetical protein
LEDPEDAAPLEIDPLVEDPPRVPVAAEEVIPEFVPVTPEDDSPPVDPDEAGVPLEAPDEVDEAARLPEELAVADDPPPVESVPVEPVPVSPLLLLVVDVLAAVEELPAVATLETAPPVEPLEEPPPWLLADPETEPEVLPGVVVDGLPELEAPLNVVVPEPFGAGPPHPTTESTRLTQTALRTRIEHRWKV